jgi:hypothetical protein
MFQGGAAIRWPFWFFFKDFCHKALKLDIFWRIEKKSFSASSQDDRCETNRSLSQGVGLGLGAGISLGGVGLAPGIAISLGSAGLAPVAAISLGVGPSRIPKPLAG